MNSFYILGIKQQNYCLKYTFIGTLVFKRS